jgi:hypothetical protein
MIIDEVNQAAGYFLDREFETFCSSGCLLRSFEDRREKGLPKPDSVFFADYLGSGFVASESAAFLLTKHIPSVMGWGIICFTDVETAGGHLKHEDETIVDWIGLRTARGKPDRKLSLVFTNDGAIPSVVELRKGELVEWEIKGRELDNDIIVRLRGYEELGDIIVPASGDIIHARLLAMKPGAGFPFVRIGDGEVLGQIRVTGAHTAEEEQM